MSLSSSAAKRLDLQLDGQAQSVVIEHAIVAGWTGRDPVAVEHHIAELEKLGVARPASTPIFYRVAAARLTTATTIEATGTDSSGEVEFVLLRHQGKIFVGVGSDHTDRKVETYNVTASKQMCEKPIAPAFWAFDDVKAHWDKVMLRSFIMEGGERVLYQEGAVAGMIAPDDLIGRHSLGLPDSSLMFCGTFAAKGGIRSSPEFIYEIDDPLLGRKIASRYSITCLPVLG
jgi:hypothetical protein